jgi:molybdate transport system substrate-binding protein
VRLPTLLILLLVGLLGACGRDPESPPPLTVFAAASVAEVVEEVATGFDGPAVRASFGASSDLARQIRDGAPADVYLSASRRWADFLAEAGVLATEPVLFARNALVCVAPESSPLAAGGLPALLSGLAPADRVAIADEGVPAGEYARRSLAATGHLEPLRGRLVGQKDVRAVVRAVERGECAAGFVYATDARVARTRTLFTLAPDTHPPIEYLAAVVRSSRRPEEARRFLAHLRGEAGRAVLTRRGFLLP